MPHATSSDAVHGGQPSLAVPHPKFVIEARSDFRSQVSCDFADPFGKRNGTHTARRCVKMDDKEKMLAAVEQRRASLAGGLDSPVGDEGLLRRQLDGIEQALYAGRIPEDQWEQHQLHWMAHCADQVRILVRRSAELMLVFEDMERKEPEVFSREHAVRELLEWWRSEGGREEYLGQIPLSERQALEEQERQWRQKWS